MTTTVAIEGTCDTRFQGVKEAFAQNFADYGEVGAAVAVVVGGRTVVDLWAGHADAALTRPWRQHTIVNVFSTTKGITAICAHRLADQGLLNIDAPVAKYWPEFAQAGKAEIPVRYLLSHRAGLPAIRQPLPPGSAYNWDTMTSALAAEEPWWEPGTRHGYHALTFGHLVGEVVRRATGRSLGTVFREEIAEPLGLDFWIGLPEEHEARVAPTIPPDPPDPSAGMASLYEAAFADPASIPGLVMLNNGGYLVPGEADTRAAHAAELPSVGGIANARALAGMYRPLALDGAFDGVRLVPEESLARMAAVSSSTGVDAVIQVPSRWSLGFVKGVDNRALRPADRSSLLISEDAFGHVG